MRIRTTVLAAAAVAAIGTLAPTLLRSQGRGDRLAREHVGGHEVVAGEVLVRFRADSRSRMPQIERDVDADDSRSIGDGTWRRIHSASRGAETLLLALASRPDVLEVEPNYIVHSTVVPNDPQLPSLWGLINPNYPGRDIHAASAWDVSTGSANTVVGVIDSGVDFTHADLAANMWTAPSSFTITFPGTPVRSITCPAGSHGFNAIAFSCVPADDNGHGTHTSGTIGAVGNNGVGVVGVNWTTRIMGLKFLDSSGTGSYADAIDAIDFAIQTKAAFAANKQANVRVLSNSWGGGGFSNALGQAIQRAANADMLFVAAAGNDNSNNDAVSFYPASYTTSNVVAVAANDSDDSRAGFSNWGATSVDLAAPGVSIMSTWPGGGYATLSGTSMATPHVAGAAALVLSGCNLTTAQLKSALLNNVDVVPAFTGLVVTNGRLNADRAIRSCVSLPTVSLTSPIGGAAYTAPASITLAANASDPDGISKVEFYQGTTLIGTSTTSPYGGAWTSVGPGSYTLTAKAYDTLGVSTVSAPVAVTVTAPGGGTSATFIGTDATTRGSWRGVYGTDGYNVIGDAVSYPVYASVVASGQASWTWASSTTDVRALQRAVGTDRVAATWYGSTFSIDLNLLDGAAHQVGLYVVDWEGGNRNERLEVRDAVTNALLDSRTVSGFQGGQYWRWTLAGHVKVQVVNVAGVNAVVSGLFFDSGPVNLPPVVTLNQPTEGASAAPPATFPLQATASDSDGILKVEFYEGTNLIATSMNGTGDGVTPYTATWSNVGAGSYTLTAKAYDTRGATTVSTAVHVTVSVPGSGPSATFIGTDATTQGSWRGVYGTDGYNVIGDTTSYPAYASVVASGQASWTWASSTTDVRALQRAVGTDRVAATWYGSTFSIDLNLLDGAAHQVGFYVVDWDGGNRNERLEVRDAVTNALLDSRTVSGFQGGQHWRWTLTGHVKVQVVNVSGLNAVVNGLFFDSGPVNLPPVVTLNQPTDGASAAPPATFPLQATASDSDGILKVEFYEGTNLIATSVNGTGNGATPYTATWSNVGAGSYTLTAKAYDTRGATTVSTAVHVTVSVPGSGPSATFIGTDATTQGSWRGVYGTDGYNVIGDTTSYPAYASVVASGQASWTWASSTTDVRALQRAVGTDRVAATWYGSTFSIDLNLLDGAAHQVGLYVVDWDGGNRNERLEVRDAVTNALLDSRTVSGFQGGQYWRWTLTGHVKVQVVNVAGVNAVVSAILFK